MPRIIYLLFFVFICHTGYAGKPVPAVVKIVPKVVLINDTTTVNQRQFDTAALNAYNKLEEFTYRENYTEIPSLWERFWKWFWSLFEIKNKNISTGITEFFKYFFIATGVGAFILLVLKLNGINLLKTFRRKPYAPLLYTEYVENIHEIDFDTEIEKATAVNNYRLAVRLLYLKTLKQLSDNGFIDWQINKTNTNYINELTNTDQREAFKHLTLQFEYAWYGDFTLNSDNFKKISLLFKNFKGGRI